MKLDLLLVIPPEGGTHIPDKRLQSLGLAVGGNFLTGDGSLQIILTCEILCFL